MLRKAFSLLTSHSCLVLDAVRTDIAGAVGRYSAFIPLYPLGILGGEMPLIWSGLPYMKERKLHSLEMPNSVNFAFSYYMFAQVRQLALTF